MKRSQRKVVKKNKRLSEKRRKKKNNKRIIPLEMQISFRRSPNNENNSYIQLKTNGHRAGVLCEMEFIEIDKLYKFQKKLTTTLKESIKFNNKRKFLIEMAILGHKYYTLLKSYIIKDPSGKEFINHLEKKSTNNLILRVVYDSQISFPLEFLFVNSTSLKDINAYLKALPNSEIIKHFFDRKAAVINHFNKFYKPDFFETYLIENEKSTINLIHGYDDSINKVDKEIEIWDMYPEILTKIEKEPENFIKEWVSPNDTNWVHFSSHLKIHKGEYALSFSNEKHFTYEELQIASGDQLKTKPVVFINACKASVSIIDNRKNFLENLFPVFARCFIAPIHSVSYECAVKFSVAFYHYFFKKNKYIIDAIELSKTKLLAEGYIEVIGYSVWELDNIFSFKNQN